MPGVITHDYEKLDSVFLLVVSYGRVEESLFCDELDIILRYS